MYSFFRNFFIVIIIIITTTPTTFAVVTVERVSISSASVEGNADSTYGSISSDGRYVAFLSGASNLVTGDTNSMQDVFVYDRQTDTIERGNVSSDEVEANGSTGNFVSISATGRYIVFDSSATNLVAGDTNGLQDIFVRDRTLGTTERVSVASDGTQADADVYIFGNAITEDGRYVVFYSDATNLVPGDTNQTRDSPGTDVFLYDRQTDTIERISLKSNGDQTEEFTVSYNSSIASDGTYVVFFSDSGLVAEDTNDSGDIYMRNIVADTVEAISVNSAEAFGSSSSNYPTITPDGRYVTFYSYSTLVVGDTNAQPDIYVRDRTLGTTERVSVASDGTQADGESLTPSISEDGRYVSFQSSANNLVAGDTGSADVFVFDRDTDTIIRISQQSNGNELGVSSSIYSGGLSLDGNYVAFSSNSNLLVASDTNSASDVFVASLGHTSDAVAPVISNVSVYTNTNIATITWTTDESSTSSVSYGETSSYGNTATGSGGVTSHSVSLSGLQSCNTYHYRVSSTDDTSNVGTSSDAIFKTSGCTTSGGLLSYIIKKLENSPIEICTKTPFLVNLKIGARGIDISNMQMFLNKNTQKNLVVDGIFGLKTKGAVEAFQLKHKEAILIPLNLKNPTGFWGLWTRKTSNSLSCEN